MIQNKGIVRDTQVQGTVNRKRGVQKNNNLRKAAIQSIPRQNSYTVQKRTSMMLATELESSLSRPPKQVVVMNLEHGASFISGEICRCYRHQQIDDGDVAVGHQGHDLEAFELRKSYLVVAVTQHPSVLENPAADQQRQNSYLQSSSDCASSPFDAPFDYVIVHLDYCCANCRQRVE